ncbi:MAG: aspartate-semialdehyde dehydrogenase [bacterium]|nr:MAG: aspartate-semialdehyde dehydrogenase [bacterium]
MGKYHVAVVGATGAVGHEFLKVLNQRNFPLKSLKLLASKRSAGKTLEFKGETLKVEELTKDSFEDMDIALFSAGGSISRDFAPHAVKSNCIVVDNSSAFRMESDVPLVVPEVNPQDIKTHKGIIANPNCSTIILLMGIYPIHKLSPIKRIIVSTYQAVSGAGVLGIDELIDQSKSVLANKDTINNVFPHQIAFNLFSHDTPINDLGYNTEEMKMVNEVRKILHEPDMRITASCVRVPIVRAHSESVNLELEKKLSLDEVRQAIDGFDGAKVVDDREKNYFPMPMDADGQDDVLVGRIRYDLSSENGLALFIAGDQILKGAALNAVQIAEML